MSYAKYNRGGQNRGWIVVSEESGIETGFSSRSEAEARAEELDGPRNPNTGELLADQERRTGSASVHYGTRSWRRAE